MSDSNLISSNPVPFDIEALSFDSFERNPARDVVCLEPIRTIIRREEEITLLRRVRKVEEIDAELACPVNTSSTATSAVMTPEVTTLEAEIQELIVYANARVNEVQDQTVDRRKDLSKNEFIQILWSRNLLPSIANHQTQPIRVKIEAIDGTWTYGAADGANQFALEVGADGNVTMSQKEQSEGDLLFTDLLPATLVALKIKSHDNGLEHTYVAHGSQLTQTTFILEPGEKLYFINNDEPGFYFDNTKHLTLRWRVLP